MALNSPVSVRETIGAVDAIVRSNEDLGWEATTRALSAVQQGEDIKEGLKAFFEKREPDWPGR